MMRVFAGATAKSMPVMGSLVLLLLAMLWPFQSALAQDRRVVAVETEVTRLALRQLPELQTLVAVAAVGGTVTPLLKAQMVVQVL
jgi:hypothetical protein